MENTPHDHDSEEVFGVLGDIVKKAHSKPGSAAHIDPQKAREELETALNPHQDDDITERLAQKQSASAKFLTLDILHEQTTEHIPVQDVDSTPPPAAEIPPAEEVVSDDEKIAEEVNGILSAGGSDRFVMAEDKMELIKDPDVLDGAIFDFVQHLVDENYFSDARTFAADIKNDIERQKALGYISAIENKTNKSADSDEPPAPQASDSGETITSEIAKVPYEEDLKKATESALEGYTNYSSLLEIRKETGIPVDETPLDNLSQEQKRKLGDFILRCAGIDDGADDTKDETFLEVSKLAGSILEKNKIREKDADSAKRPETITPPPIPTYGDVDTDPTKKLNVPTPENNFTFTRSAAGNIVSMEKGGVTFNMYEMVEYTDKDGKKYNCKIVLFNPDGKILLQHPIEDRLVVDVDQIKKLDATANENLSDDELKKLSMAAFPDDDAPKEDFEKALNYLLRIKDPICKSDELFGFGRWLSTHDNIGWAKIVAEKMEDDINKEYLLKTIETEEVRASTPSDPVPDPVIPTPLSPEPPVAPTAPATTPEPPPVELVAETPEAKARRERVEAIEKELSEARDEYAKANIEWKNRNRKGKSWWQKTMSDFGFEGHEKKMPPIERRVLDEAEKRYILAKKERARLILESGNDPDDIKRSFVFTGAPIVQETEKFVEGKTVSEKLIERAEEEYKLLQRKILESVPPIEKRVIAKIFDKYRKWPLPARVALSTILMTGTGVLLGGVTAPAALGYAGYRATRGLVGGFVSQGTGLYVGGLQKADSMLNKKRTLKKYGESVGLNMDNFEMTEARLMKFFEEQEKKEKRQNIYKAGAMFLTGAGTSMLFGAYQGKSDTFFGRPKAMVGDEIKTRTPETAHGAAPKLPEAAPVAPPHPAPPDHAPLDMTKRSPFTPKAAAPLADPVKPIIPKEEPSVPSVKPIIPGPQPAESVAKTSVETVAPAPAPAAPPVSEDPLAVGSKEDLASASIRTEPTLDHSKNVIHPTETPAARSPENLTGNSKSLGVARPSSTVGNSEFLPEKSGTGPSVIAEGIVSDKRVVVVQGVDGDPNKLNVYSNKELVGTGYVSSDNQTHFTNINSPEGVKITEVLDGEEFQKSLKLAIKHFGNSSKSADVPVDSVQSENNLEPGGEEAGIPFKPDTVVDQASDESETPMETVVENKTSPSINQEIAEHIKQAEESRARLNQIRLEREALELKLRNIENYKIPPPPATLPEMSAPLAPSPDTVSSISTEGPFLETFQSNGSTYHIAEVAGAGKVLQMELEGGKMAEIAHTVKFNGKDLLVLDDKYQEGDQYEFIRKAYKAAMSSMDPFHDVKDHGIIVGLPGTEKGSYINILRGDNTDPNSVKVLLNGKQIAVGQITEKGPQVLLDNSLKHSGIFTPKTVYEHNFEKKVEPLIKTLRYVAPKTVDMSKAA